MRSMLGYLLATFVMSGIVGCVSATSNKWPPFDEKRLRLVLVSGHFSNARELDERPCLLTRAEYLDLNNHCYSKRPSMATLNVYGVVHGSVYEKRLHVAYHPFREGASGPGDGKPMLVLLRSDGKYFELAKYSQLALTSRNEWALPVFEDAQLDILPCGAKPLVRPVSFAKPAPSLSSKDYSERDFAELAGNPRIHVVNEQLFIEYGVLLDDMKQFLNSNFPEPDDYYCEEYLQSE